MTFAVSATAVAIAALIGTAPLTASAQAAKILGETDGATQARASDNAASASSAGPVVSPIHKKTGDLARIARDAAQAAASGATPPTPPPTPADAHAKPADATSDNAAPLGNQPADRAPDTPTAAPDQGAAPNPGATVKAHVKIRKALA